MVTGCAGRIGADRNVRTCRWIGGTEKGIGAEVATAVIARRVPASVPEQVAADPCAAQAWRPRARERDDRRADGAAFVEADAADPVGRAARVPDQRATVHDRREAGEDGAAASRA